MKKIITLLVLAVLFCSCSMCYTVTTTGDISLLNDSGETIDTWKGAIISYSEMFGPNFSLEGTETYRGSEGLKVGGARLFTDREGISHTISGGIQIVDNIQTVYSEIPNRHYQERQLKASSKKLKNKEKPEQDRLEFADPIYR